MTRPDDLKARARERMSKTGESYTTARRHVVSQAGMWSKPESERVIPGWFLSGSDPEDYEYAKDPTGRRDGAASVALRAMTDAPRGFATFMQQCLPGEYAARRVRYSAEVKAERVKGWAGLWMRIDGRVRALSEFDNMQSRPIKGTLPWTRYDVVLDVAAEATVIAFGLLLTGAGCVWLANVSLEVAGPDVATTGRVPTIAERPHNLGFEE